MIPDWNLAHVLPPIRPNEAGHSKDRSPYKISTVTLVDRFASSKDRITILDGLLRYRKSLCEAGIVDGFQWLNGSFLENIEASEDRPPNDVDVVTFFKLPEGKTQLDLFKGHSNLFQSTETKKDFLVDAYPCLLGEPTEKRHINQISYWYSMWSHKRDYTWKGFVQVDLSAGEDIAMEVLLKQKREELR